MGRTHDHYCQACGIGFSGFDFVDCPECGEPGIYDLNADGCERCGLHHEWVETLDDACLRDRCEWAAMPWWKKLLTGAILGGEGRAGR